MQERGMQPWEDESGDQRVQFRDTEEQRSGTHWTYGWGLRMI